MDVNHTVKTWKDELLSSISVNSDRSPEDLKFKCIQYLSFDQYIAYSIRTVMIFVSLKLDNLKCKRPMASDSGQMYQDPNPARFEE